MDYGGVGSQTHMLRPSTSHSTLRDESSGSDSKSSGRRLEIGEV